MERKNDFHLLENLTKKNSRRRLLKRGLALVSVVVLLVTANVLKRNAVAMVGETHCGYDYDHVHSEECFDADGALICDLHVHTDECYEEPTPEEVEVDLSDLEGATEAVEEAEAVVPEAVPSDGTFDLAGSHQVMLSEVLAQTMLPVSRDQIEMVGLVDDSLQGDEAQGEAPVAVAMLEQDVAITALRDFSTAEIAIVTADDIYTIQLMNGAASAEIEAAAEETTEKTEETEETVEENTENIEEIIETTEEEPQEVAAEPAQESEITEAVEEHTEENSEANIEETVEEFTAEITDGDEAETEPAEIDETVTEEAAEETAETEETAEVEETEEAAAEMQAIEASEEAAEAVAEIEETEENTEETAEIEETEENTEETAEIEETEENTEEAAEVEETEEATEETEEESEEETTEEETAEEETEEESEEKSEEEETEEEATEEETAEEESEEESTEEEAAEEKTEEEETTEEESEEEAEEEETSEEEAAEEESAEGETTEEEAAEEEESEEESEEEETTEEETSEEETKGESEEAAEALDIETLFPAQTFEDHAGNIRVTVTAGVGAFPAGTEMRLTPVWDQETLDGIADSVSEDFVEVKQVLAVDIAFFNAEGEEIEPLLPVSVVMAVEEIEQHQDAVVVHMDDEGNTEVVEQTETAFTEDTERALNVELPAAEDAETQMAQLVEKLEAEAAEQTEAETEPAEAEAADEPAAEAEGVEVVTEEVAIETEKAEPAEETTEVTFEADGFSLYAVVVTETIETRYIAADGATFNISVRYGEDAKIPANATLAVEELTGEATEDYLAQTEELLAEGETITLARYFDITILDTEGNALQPQAPVSVEVKLADDPADAVQAMHFAEEGAELIDASRNDDEAVTFSAEGFSVYGIVYTVDFYYDVDGKTYEYHIKGGDVQSLKALLPILKVVEEDAAEEFVANIEDVRFSDESLVKVFRVDEDTTAGAILEALGVKLEAHARADEAVEAPEEISDADIDALEAAAEAAGETADEVVEAANPSAALTEEDIEAIKAKTFTAPDWALVSLQPFTSHESLTITLKNGEVVTIRVEDAGQPNPSTYVGKKIIIYTNAEQKAMTANWESNQYRTQLNSIDLSGADSNVAAHWTLESGNGGYYLKSLSTGKYLRIDNININLVDKNNATPFAFQLGDSPDYRIYDSNSYDNVLTYCPNGTYNPFFSAPSGAYGNDTDRWLEIKVVTETATTKKFSVDVATWTSNGERWGNLSSKYFGTENGNGKSGDRYPASGTTAGSLGDDGKTYLKYGFGAGPYSGYEFAFWAYQENGRYRQLSSITSMEIPNDPTEYFAYFTPKGTKLFIYQSEDTSKGTVDKSYGYSDERGATANPQGGYAFAGWYNENNKLISLDQTFSPVGVSGSMVLTAKFIQPAKGIINISVNDADGGDVIVTNNGQEESYCGDQQTKDTGMLNRTITAKPKDGYTFAYWTLNGVRFIDNDVLSWDPAKGPTPRFQSGDQLQAVFLPSYTIDASGNAHSTIQVGTEKKEQFERWLDSLNKGKPLSADKSAKVYDYDNRIYQIDIDAESARVNATANIGIAFILDASNSMQFPANIAKTGKTLVLTQNNLNNAFPNESGPLYFISDPEQTSTMYRLYKEDGIWYAVDASYSDPAKIIERRFLVDYNIYYADYANAGHVPLAYPIYRDTGIGKRVNYLNGGLNATINTLRSIVNRVNDPTQYKINAAYTMFCAYTPLQYPANTNLPNGFGWHDFAPVGNLNVNMGDTDGGTRQDLGLQDAQAFNWNSIDAGQRYAILITDGAAVIGGNGKTWDGEKTYQQVQDNIVDQAKALKDLGVTLITVGLSTKNVKGGSNVMATIASENPNHPGQKLFFEAESGDDLQNIMYEIVQTLVKNATLGCQIVDEVDPAFYPVKADGTPIQPGAYDKNGNLLSDTSGEEWYEWIKDQNNNWKIVWHKQYVGFDPTAEDSHDQPWHGVFYVKAKEDFLGANTISTNVGDCSVTEEAYRYSGGDWMLIPGNEQTKVALPVPYVNVDELSLTQNSSEWTVYLGTGVNPLEELKNLFDKIEVKEVVTQTVDGQHVTMTGASDTLYPIERSNTDGRTPKSGVTPETFPLSEVAQLSDGDWTTLINDGTVDKQYDAYGHNDVGIIRYQLVKTLAEDEDGLTNEAHETKVVGEAVEQYTLKAVYMPTTKSDPADWHTTPGGSHGKAPEFTNISTNNHVINVFAKKLAVKKMDATLNTELHGAKFALVKTIDGSTPKVGDGSTYIVIEELAVDDSGSVFTSGDIARPKANEKYFLIETQAPVGYVGLGVPVPVSLVIKDKYRAVPRVSDAYGTDPLSMPYDWIEEATLSLDTRNASQIKLATAEWQRSSDTPGQDSECTTLHYMVPNNSGVKLPSTGGAGTGAYTAIGGALALLAIALMLRKQREN